MAQASTGRTAEPSDRSPNLTDLNMNKTWLEIVFPLSLALLVCTMGVLVLSMLGLLTNAVPPDDAVSYCQGAGPLPEETRRKQADARLVALTYEEVTAIAAGEALFKGNCAECHAVNEVVIGPALAGITERRPVSWITRWMKKPGKMVAGRDPYALKIFTEYYKQEMPGFQLSDKEVKAILAYIKEEEFTGPPATYASTSNYETAPQHVGSGFLPLEPFQTLPLPCTTTRLSP